LAWCRAAQVLSVSLLVAAAMASQAGVLSHELERAMARRGAQADTTVIVRFADQDTAVDRLPNPGARDNRLVVALQARSARNRAALEPFLAANGAERVKNLWIINGLAATLPASAVRQLSELPGIERVDLDAFVQGGRSQRTPRSRMRKERDAAAPALVDSESTVPPRPAAETTPVAYPAWNVAAIRAPELWAKGFTGQGVVVAEMDTGVDLAHPDLRGKYRGGTNSWFDPHGEEATPYDALGHGTQAMGVMVGGPAIGVAPGARWIAARLFNGDGRASMSDIHRAFQWLLDPDGDPSTVDSPHVVNASWTLTGPGSGACRMEFSSDIRALRDAGIAVVFAAGNDGPSARTSSSPGNNPGVLSVGAVDVDLEMARQSSRGPSSCDGAVFPRLVAPGVNVRTADLSHGGQPSYAYISGSSLAAPHVTGALALLMSAFPSLPAAEIEAALLRGAKGLVNESADAGQAPRLVDALAAFNILHESRRPILADAARQ
jgi:bacillopeptidase F